MADEVEINISATENVSETVERIGNTVQDESRVIVNSMGSTEEAFDSAARSSGRFGEGLDRMSGATSQLSGGLGDVGGALTEAFGEDHPIGQFGAEMEKMGTIVMGLTGVLDLLALANAAVSLSWIKTTAAMVGARIASVAQTVATGVATAAQWLWNLAMTANPIGIIIVAVAALVAGIVWLATQTTFFQDLWNTVWKGIVAYFEFVVNFYKSAWNTIVGAAKKAIDWYLGIPGMLARAFSTVAGVLTAPFRMAFNAIANMWNRTIGAISFRAPDWIPGIGGKGFSVPNIPTLAVGGDIVRSGMAMVHAGERVVPAKAVGLGTTGGGGGMVTIRFEIADDSFREFIRKNVTAFGGSGDNSVQVAFG